MKIDYSKIDLNKLDEVENSFLQVFWEYYKGVEAEMIEMCDWEEGEKRILPLSNKLICAAFAATTWKYHSQRLSEEIDKMEIEMREARLARKEAKAAKTEEAK